MGKTMYASHIMTYTSHEGMLNLTVQTREGTCQGDCLTGKTKIDG